MVETMMSMSGVVDQLRKDNPGLRFAVNKNRNAVGYFSEGLGRWQVLLGLRLDGCWGRLPDILVDGKPLVSDWEEVEK